LVRKAGTDVDRCSPAVSGEAGSLDVQTPDARLARRGR